MKKALLLMLGVIAFPFQAFSQTSQEHDFGDLKFSHGVSASLVSIKLDEYDDALRGASLNYDLSVPLFSSRFQLMTGIGCSLAKYKQGMRKKISIQVLNETDFCEQRLVEIQYVYLNVPVNIGFKLVDEPDLYIIPFVGVSAKYNMAYDVKNQYDSNTYQNAIIRIYGGETEEDDANRFTLQYNIGAEVGFRHFYGTFSYLKDSSKLFDRATIAPDLFYREWINCPGAFSCWKVGIGFKF